MIRKNISIAALIIAFSNSSAGSEKSEAYAKAGALSWAAFSCSVLAKAAKNGSEEKRLFDYGYSQGSRLLVAFSNQEIRLHEMVSTDLPYGIIPILGGPNIDFGVGRIYEAAKNGIDYDLKISDGKPVRLEDQHNHAIKLFRDKNCQLIGVEK